MQDNKNISGLTRFDNSLFQRGDNHLFFIKKIACSISSGQAISEKNLTPLSIFLAILYLH